MSKSVENPVVQQDSPGGTARYLFFTTLAATLLPPVFVSSPLLLLLCFTWVGLFVAPLLIFGVVMLARWFFEKALPRFSQALQEGKCPRNAFVLNLPFFLPFFYIAVVSAIGFSDGFEDMGARGDFFCMFLAPYFALLAVLGAIMFFGLGGIEMFARIPLVISFFVAVFGSWKIYRHSPHREGLVRAPLFYATLCVLFLVPVFYFQDQMRLFTRSEDFGVHHVREEYDPHSWDPVHDETDLLPYLPFSPDNLLIRLHEEPTLEIPGNHPQLHGALALYPVYAAAVQEIYRGITEEEAKILVCGGTSPEAFSALLEDRADMIFMLTLSEKQLQRARDVEKELTIIPIGWEAFVFFVSRTNEIRNLSSDQIRDIYSRRITNWKQLGGKNERIFAFQRPEGSGSQSAMQRFMGSQILDRPIREEYQSLMGGIVNRVADYRNYGNSIGYSFRYYVEGMFQHEGVELLGVDAVSPSGENIRNGTYPLREEIVIITAGTKNPHVPALIEWFRGPQGRKIIDRIGYVSLSE